MRQALMIDGPMAGKVIAVRDDIYLRVPVLHRADRWHPDTQINHYEVESVEYIIHRWKRVWFSSTYCVGRTVRYVGSIHNDVERLYERDALSAPADMQVEVLPCPDFLNDFAGW